MYTPAHFREARVEVLRAFIARHPLGALITHGEAGSTVELVPMQLIADGDAPADYVDGMLRGIVGFEIALTGIEGKFKASQNRSSADRAGVRAGLAAAGLSGADLEELCRDAPA
jgi:predicted FMN-binding regulatory protein PaiB